MSLHDVSTDGIDDVTSLNDVTSPAYVTSSTSPPTKPWAGAEEFLWAEDLKFLSSLLPTIIYLGLLSLLGLAGNVVVFAVYYKRFKPSSTNTFILAISVCDLLINMSTLPVEVVEIRFQNTFHSVGACKVVWTAVSSLVLCSGFLLLSVALDRQRIVCRLTRSKTSRSVMLRVKGVILLCVVLAFACSMPRLVLTSLHPVTFPDTNVTGVTCSFRDNGRHPGFRAVYEVFMNVLFVLTLCIFLISYGRIGYFLHKHKKLRAAIVNKEQKAPVSTPQIIFTTDETQDGHMMDSFTNANTPSLEIHDTSTVKADRDDQSHSLEIQEKVTTKADRDDLEIQKRARANASAKPDTPDRNQVLGVQTVKDSLQTEERNDLLALRMEHSGSPPSEDTKDNLWQKFRRSAKKLKRRVPTEQKGACMGRGQGKKIPARTTLMLFMLTVVFVINYFPYLVIIFTRQDTSSLHVKGLDPNVAHVMIRSYYVNSAINPLIYAFCSAKFRHECHCLWASLWSKRSGAQVI